MFSERLSADLHKQVEVSGGVDPFGIVWNLLTCRNICEIHSVSHKGSANGPDSLTFSIRII